MITHNNTLYYFNPYAAPGQYLIEASTKFQDKTFNAENLASAMKASGTKVDASTKTKLDAMMGPKPVIPPPRPRPRWDA